MKSPLLCLLALLAASSSVISAQAAPTHAVLVHVSVKPTALVQPNSDGFITLASVADLTGGDPSMRTRLSGVLVARVPLSGESRRLTRGDLALKLRQAGCDPDTQIIFEGAVQAEVTSSPDSNTPGSSMTVGAGSAPVSLPSASTPSASTPSGSTEDSPSPILIHRGDAVTIYIQTGPLTITAPGTARDNGRVGDTIRVHREGVMTDLTVTVLDTQTVRLEI